MPRRARALAETRARDGLGHRSRAAIACSSSRSKRRSSGRVDHSFTYERAGAARRGAHPADARRRRRRADRHRAVRARSRIVRPPLPGAAQREQSDRERSPACRQACCTASAAASSRVLWLARKHWLVWRPPIAAGCSSAALLARELARVVGQPRGSVRTRRRRSRRSGPSRGLALLIAVAGGLALCARVHGGGEPDAPRIPASSAAVALVVARRRADAAGARVARSAAICSCRSSWRSSRRSTTRRTAGSDGGSPPKC